MCPGMPYEEVLCLVGVIVLRVVKEVDYLLWQS